MLGLGLAIEGAAAMFPLGDRAWMGATALTAVLNALVLGFLWRYRDGFVARLYVVGLMVGAGELVSDAWLAEQANILTYNPGGPFVWQSPLYMPFAWAMDVVELGVLGVWAVNRWGLALGVAAIAILGGVSLPLSETLAHWADWWQYANCWMVFGITPVLLLVGEPMIAAAIVPLALRAGRASATGLVALGAAMSVWIYAVSRLTFALFGQAPG